ncbi:hypothetical protein KV697_13845 [Sphingomonas sanguinis]|uniref:hypothetical protein n=1 Tax=Sphingomonas sanguinis TaxID=33051 RepID=UPI001C58F729|nr:hypothetical protein [Sphingomonas sanguinis]QXT34858.1 hypothetical protein KV697_13845 [Sphingomonas sanguinis]
MTKLRALLDHAPRSVRRRFVLPPTEGDSQEAVARMLYEQRRMRAEAFGDHSTVFVEPAWDLLLDLFLARAEGRIVSASATSIGACVPPTTALRCVGALRRRGLVTTRPHPTDRRMKVVELSPDGAAMVERYLSMLRSPGD